MCLRRAVASFLIGFSKLTGIYRKYCDTCHCFLKFFCITKNDIKDAKIKGEGKIQTVNFPKGIKDSSTSFQLYQIQKIIFYLGKTRSEVDFLLTRWENVWKGRWTFFDGRKLGNGNDSRLLGFSRSPRVPASYRLWLLSFTFLTDVRLLLYQNRLGFVRRVHKKINCDDRLSVSFWYQMSWTIERLVFSHMSILIIGGFRENIFVFWGPTRCLRSIFWNWHNWYSWTFQIYKIVLLKMNHISMSKSEHSTFNYLHTTTFEKSCTNQNDDTNTQDDNDELYKPWIHDFFNF